MILYSSIADKNISEASLFQFDEWHPQSLVSSMFSKSLCWFLALWLHSTTSRMFSPPGDLSLLNLLSWLELLLEANKKKKLHCNHLFFSFTNWHRYILYSSTEVQGWSILVSFFLSLSTSDLSLLLFHLGTQLGNLLVSHILSLRHYHHHCFFYKQIQIMIWSFESSPL